jgi:ATP-dependent RNA helicase DDX5/DBP2
LKNSKISQGTAFTFFTDSDNGKASDLVKVLEEAKQTVPVELAAAASMNFGRGRGNWSNNNRKRNWNNYGNGGGGGGGGGYGGQSKRTKFGNFWIFLPD